MSRPMEPRSRPSWSAVIATIGCRASWRRCDEVVFLDEIGDGGERGDLVAGDEGQVVQPQGIEADGVGVAHAHVDEAALAAHRAHHLAAEGGAELGLDGVGRDPEAGGGVARGDEAQLGEGCSWPS